MPAKRKTPTSGSKSGSEFEDPPVQEHAQAEEDFDDEEDLDFDPEDPGEGEPESQAGDEDETAPSADERVLQLKADVEAALFAHRPASGDAASFSGEGAFTGADNIVGVGLGTPEIDFESIGDDGPGAQVLNVYVAEPTGQEDVKRSVYDSFGVQAVGDDSVPINVIPTGPIDALAHRHRARPAPGGISVAHYRVTAGTLGCLARGRRGTRRNRVLMLSNNHVLANSNNAQRNDSIIQPGRLDGGVNPRDQVAVLERFVRIDFSGRPNYLDCATGWCWSDRVRRDLIYRSGGQWRHFRISSRTRACQVGMTVGKSGRTTQLTSGRITDCNASIRVNYGQGRFGLFKDQITVRGLRGDFSRPGDSGSVIWSYDNRRNPVGLLFAGGGGYTFANKIGRVLSALDINLWT